MKISRILKNTSPDNERWSNVVRCVICHKNQMEMNEVSNNGKTFQSLRQSLEPREFCRYSTDKAMTPMDKLQFPSEINITKDPHGLWRRVSGDCHQENSLPKGETRLGWRRSRLKASHCTSCGHPNRDNDMSEKSVTAFDTESGAWLSRQWQWKPILRGSNLTNMNPFLNHIGKTKDVPLARLTDWIMRHD
jgi:hypothetical protein